MDPDRRKNPDPSGTGSEILDYTTGNQVHPYKRLTKKLLCLAGLDTYYNIIRLQLLYLDIPLSVLCYQQP